MFLRKNKKTNSEISLEESLSYDAEGNELHLEDIIGTESDLVPKNIEDKDDKKMILNEIDKLNKKSKDIRNSKSKIMLESKEKTDESNSINMNNTNNNLRNSINSTNK